MLNLKICPLKLSRQDFQEQMASGSLGVALTPQPTDTPITIHPIIDIGLAVKACDFPGLGARVLGYDSPIIFRLSDRSEGHFCFCHEDDTSRLLSWMMCSTNSSPLSRRFTTWSSF
jgi:hypothetical protein